MDGMLAAFHDLAPKAESFRDAVVDGLGRRPKAIPCKFLYDARGSALFDEICALPEYYPTRTEIGILEANAAAIAAAIGPGAQVIEFGSGSSRKIRILLDALCAPAVYAPVDISGVHLQRSARDLAGSYPQVPVVAVCADYTRPFRLPPLPGDGTAKRVGFFPGSTIGNFEPAEAVAFLAQAARLLGPGGEMLVGVDLKKDAAILDAAYNDSAGVTAAFNLNLLARANRELDAGFDLARFAHDAFYNADAGRIEIYIRSEIDQVVRCAGQVFRFAAGERVHTEYSCKYTVPEFQALAARAGFRALQVWTDPRQLFSLHSLRVTA